MDWQSRQCRELPIQHKEREARLRASECEVSQKGDKPYSASLVHTLGPLILFGCKSARNILRRKPMSTYAYREVLNEVLNQVQHLTFDDQLRLVEDLVANIRLQNIALPKNHNVMEFRGMAKQLWEGVDVEKYIDEERNSWER